MILTRIAIIPARGGSTRIPRKNIKLFHGKPIISYSIEIATNADLFDAIFVSTEDQEIADVARSAGAEVITRPLDLAQNQVGTQTVMNHAIETIGQRLDSSSMACCLYATAPLVEPNDLRAAYMMQVLRPCRYAISVATDPLRDIGNFYIGDSNYFRKGMELWSTHTGLYVMPTDRAIDINTPEDWTRAEEMYAALHQDDKVAYG